MLLWRSPLNLVTFYFPHRIVSGPDPGYNETFMIGYNTIQRLFCLLRNHVNKSILTPRVDIFREVYKCPIFCC